MISASRALIDRTVEQLRACSAGSRECVAYWVAELDAPSAAVDLVHPIHRSTALGYEVDDRWLTRFMFELADRRRSAIAQLHTHPGPFVDHSPTDDEFVLVPTPGFVSIVLPYHAQRDVQGWGVHVLERSGRWHLDPDAVTW
jgi:hypothetical protein